MNRTAPAPSRPRLPHTTNGAAHAPPAVPDPAVPVTSADVERVTRGYVEAQKALDAADKRTERARGRTAAATIELDDRGWDLGDVLNRAERGDPGRPKKGSEHEQRESHFQGVVREHPTLSKTTLHRWMDVAHLPRERVDALHAAGVVGVTALLTVARKECKKGADGKWTWTGKTTHDAGGLTFAEWLKDNPLPKDRTAEEWRALLPEQHAHSAIATMLDLEKRSVTDPKEWEGPAAVLAAYDEWTRRARLITKRAAKPAKVNEPREAFGDAA